MQTENFYFFWKHEFGQWTQREIVDELGARYNCCEQYMMFGKAILFQDFDCAKKIMAELNPKEQQRLGKEVKRFDKDVWDRAKVNIVYRGNVFKFTQHRDLADRLIETYPRLLVEASPYDCVWGVGLAENNLLILDSRNWRGQNLLGQVLTQVRDEIIDRMI